MDRWDNLQPRSFVTEYVHFIITARSIAAKWKAVSIEDRADYNKKAEEDKIRYQREMELWRAHQQKIQPNAEGWQMKAPPTATQDNVAAARMPELLMRHPSAVSYYRDIDPIETSWHAAALVQNPLSFHVPSAALHSFAASERGIGVEEDERKVSAAWLSSPGLVSANHPQPLPAATAMALAMPHQQSYLHHTGLESFTTTFPAHVAAPVAYPEQQQQQQQPHSEQREGLESLAQKLDDESTELFLSMFRP